jgi:hypothetical protein
MNLSTIKSDVSNLLNEVLVDIHFDPTVKEVGHAFADRFESTLAKKLMIKSSKYSKPHSLKHRDPADWFSDSIPTNCKFGYNKKGQPNLISFNRFFNGIISGELEEYIIVSVDAKTRDVKVFRLIDWLHCVNYNTGTGQLMLKESVLNKVYDESKPKVTRFDAIKMLIDIDAKACDDHIELKLKQHSERAQLAKSFLK